MKNSSNPLSNSKLTETILKINPGVDRQTKIQTDKLTNLMKKSTKTAEYSKKVFKNDFQTRMERRKKIYDRLKPKLDESTRMKINQIKEKDRKKEIERQKLKEAEGKGQ